MDQHSTEWFEARRGKLTASIFDSMMAKTTTQDYLNLVADKAWERWSGKVIEGYTNSAMQRGTTLEPDAREWYSFVSGNEVQEEGFAIHPDYDFIGCSVDGLVDLVGLVEIKCPLHRSHMETVRTGQIPAKYRWQVQGQLWIKGREWNDFVSYNPDAPKSVIIRAERDDKIIAELEQRAIETNARIEEMVEQLRRG